MIEYELQTSISEAIAQSTESQPLPIKYPSFGILLFAQK